MAKKKRLYKMNKGGEIIGEVSNYLPLLNSLIPGVGTGSAALGKLISGLMKDKPGSPINETSNIYMKGGKLKKYKGKSHKQGGIKVDANANPVAEVEGGEATVTDSNNESYVFSDKLGTAARIKKLYAKTKGKDSISRKTRELGTKMLIDENESLKNGGKLPNYQDGGILPLPTLRIGVNRYSTNKLPSILDKNNLANLPIQAGSSFDNQFGNLDQTSISTPPILETDTKKLFPNIGKIGMGLKGAALLGSAIDAFQKPERETPRLTNYNTGDQLSQGLGVSDDSLQKEADLATSKALDMNRQASGNIGSYMNRAQSILSRRGRDAAGIARQNKQYNDQVNLQRARREDMKAQDKAAKLREIDVANLQNKAMKQDNVANLMQNVNNLGTEFTRLNAVKEATENMNDSQKKDFLLKAAALNIQNPNFQIGSLDDIQKALDAGDYDSVMKAIVSYKK